MSLIKFKDVLSKEDKEIWKYDNLLILEKFINKNNFKNFESYIKERSLYKIYSLMEKNYVLFNEDKVFFNNEYKYLDSKVDIDLNFKDSSFGSHIFNIDYDTDINIQVFKSSDEIVLLNYFYFNLKENCKLNLNIVSNGSSFEKNIILSNQKNNSNVNIRTRSLLVKENKVDFSILSKIDGENCILNQDLKAVLFDKSQYSSLGEINILKNSNGADAKHYTSTISMSDDIKIYARPFLKIDNGNVKCAHGCPSGYISDSDLFYMQSRGLSKKEAEKMFIYSFLNDSSVLIKNILEN